MSEKCPYCKHEQEINHDDGYGYEEDEDHEQGCVSCGEEFKFTTSIMYCYEIHCRDGDHELVDCGPEHPQLWDCEKCDYYEVRRIAETTP